MAKYVLSRKALEDITVIWQFTLENWSEKQADAYYFLLTETFERIAKSPGIGKSYNFLYPGLFGIKTGSHIIFYRSRNSESIEIIRILHGSMDLTEIYFRKE